MAKKSSRGERKNRQVRLSEAQLVQPGEGAAPLVVREPQKADKTQTVDLKQEYRYVIADLKRIAILAAAMLVVLIVLAIALT